jgi:hypothetical protein
VKRIQIEMGRGGRGGGEAATGCSTEENLARAGP